MVVACFVVCGHGRLSISELPACGNDSFVGVFGCVAVGLHMVDCCLESVCTCPTKF